MTFLPLRRGGFQPTGAPGIPGHAALLPGHVPRHAPAPPLPVELGVAAVLSDALCVELRPVLARLLALLAVGVGKGFCISPLKLHPKLLQFPEHLLLPLPALVQLALHALNLCSRGACPVLCCLDPHHQIIILALELPHILVCCLHPLVWHLTLLNVSQPLEQPVLLLRKRLSLPLRLLPASLELLHLHRPLKHLPVQLPPELLLPR
mmetsp:Transcript_21366/g.53634  ORF Transcript_21366/g.53634 Transcript_21366/m.53634 type:complete len:207 (+) Transcript_21366:227-847(+)